MSSFKHGTEENLTEITQSEDDLTKFKVSSDSFRKVQKIIALTGIRDNEGKFS